MIDQSLQIIRRQALAESQLPDTIHPLIKRVLANRAITQAKQLDYSLKNLHDPYLLKGMDQAVERLWQALKLQERIVIAGDFDADGATSVAVLMRGFQQMGFQHLQFVVPDRFRFGYGLSAEFVDEIALLKPQLIITVDAGISSVDGVAHANQLGIEVMITDHHLPGEQLPDACAILNPNQLGCLFPSKALAGVGVAFYLLVALRKFLREQAWFTAHIPEPNLADLLDLVALGTVADVVPLDYSNRILVNQGLARIRAGKACVGIQQLLQIAGKDYRYVASTDIAFAIAPRLNAAGRLDDMSQGIMLLLTDSQDLAHEFAQLMDEFNRDRRVIEQQMQQEALQITEQVISRYQSFPRGLSLYHEQWHQGVVGLVASRIKERVHRPVIAFAKADNGELKGSGRSIVGVHLRDTLADMATQHPDLITRFGGHAMAAGLTLQADKLEAFEHAFTQQLAHYPANLFEPTIETDGDVAVDDMNLYVAQLLRDIPWGSQLPEPLFEGEFFLHKSTVLAEKHLKLLLSVNGQVQHNLPAILFNAKPHHHAAIAADKIYLMYRMAVNHYRGMQSLQLIVEDIRLVR